MRSIYRQLKFKRGNLRFLYLLNFSSKGNLVVFWYNTSKFLKNKSQSCLNIFVYSLKKLYFKAFFDSKKTIAL